MDAQRSLILDMWQKLAMDAQRSPILAISIFVRVAGIAGSDPSTTVLTEAVVGSLASEEASSDRGARLLEQLDLQVDDLIAEQ